MLTAESPNGTRWYRTLENDTPVLSSTTTPPVNRSYSLFDAPTQLSQSRLYAWRWVVSDAGVFSVVSAPLPQAITEAIEFVSPSGTSYVLRLDDAGAESLGAYPESLRPFWPLLKEGRDGPVYISDPRFPRPHGTGG